MDANYENLVRAAALLLGISRCRAEVEVARLIRAQEFCLEDGRTYARAYSAVLRYKVWIGAVRAEMRAHEQAQARTHAWV